MLNAFGWGIRKANNILMDMIGKLHEYVLIWGDVTL